MIYKNNRINNFFSYILKKLLFSLKFDFSAICFKHHVKNNYIKTKMSNIFIKNSTITRLDDLWVKDLNDTCHDSAIRCKYICVICIYDKIKT